MEFTSVKKKMTSKERRRENSRKIKHFLKKEHAQGYRPDMGKDADPYQIEIGDSLRRIRMGIAHTQKEIALLLSVSQQEISNIEHGKTGITAKQLYRMIRYSCEIDPYIPLSLSPIPGPGSSEGPAGATPEIVRIITYLLFLMFYNDRSDDDKSLTGKELSEKWENSEKTHAM